MPTEPSDPAEPAEPTAAAEPSSAEPLDLAAVDLGSNSFHLVVGRDHGDRIQLLDRIREPVRLAEGLREDRSLAPKVARRALDCLERFGERLRELGPDRVRAVGTQTLRRASKARDFLEEARAALGVPIELLPGSEEARLIYIGVAHDVEPAGGLRFVADIGGGSTEIILGQGREPGELASLDMGCVVWSQRFFADGHVTAKRMRAAVVAARLVLELVESRFGRLSIDECLGASGTIKSAAEILRANGWGDGGIDLKGLQMLSSRLIDAGCADDLDLPGIRRDRRPVLAGGLSILLALFEGLELERMDAAQGALREGILHDLSGRLHAADVRDRTARDLAARWAVDRDQSRRVLATAHHLFDDVQVAWELDPAIDRKRLTWAAQLLEIGMALAFRGYHKHGAYLLGHADLPGFGLDERQMLSLLVRTHRGRFKSSDFEDLPSWSQRSGPLLAVLLRLAYRLHRSRRPELVPPLRAKAEEGRIALRFPPGWLDTHPLVRADLAEEATALREAGQSLTFK